MKSQEECEEILRVLVNDKLEQFRKQKSLANHSHNYHRICAQITLCELIGAVPEAFCEELQCRIDDGYKLAIAQSR